MAFSIITTPQLFQPAHNPIYFIVDSSNAGACSFKYIADLYIDGVFTIRLFAFPEGPNDYGVFRVDRILQDYVSWDLKPNLLGFERNSDSIDEYYLKFYEEFDSNSPCTGITTVSALLDTSSVYFAWNGAIQHNDFPAFDYTDYIMNADTSKFLTTSPDNLPIGVEERMNLNFIQKETEEICYVEIKTYGVNQTLIGTYQIDSSVALASPSENMLLSVGVGPWNLNYATLSLGSQPVIYDDVYYYDVTLFNCDSPGVAVSETKLFKIDKSCTKFITRVLWFLNRLGGFDRYSFKLKSFRKIDITRNEYSRLENRLDGSTYGYAIRDRGRSVMSVEGKENKTFNTNWLTEDEALWIEELFTSPEVYIQDTEIVTEYAIDGGTYNAGTISFSILPASLQLPNGTVFTYNIDDLSMFGAPNTGNGEVTAFVGGLHRTTVPATVDPGLSPILSGVLTVIEPNLIPVVVKSPQFEEKLKANKKRIQYSIEVSMASDVNIQRQ